MHNIVVACVQVHQSLFHCCALCRAAGGVREDKSHVVVLDGLCTDDDRVNILEWLTGQNHDYNGPPPEHKWQQVCVDRAGDRATWGLQEEVRH